MRGVQAVYRRDKSNFPVLNPAIIEVRKLLNGYLKLTLKLSGEANFELHQFNAGAGLAQAV
jgi:hypothetical protein